MRSLTIALLLCLSVAMMFGQAPTGTISGAVVDQQGAAVPGATVTATNQETKVDYTTKTVESGAFLFPNLPAATYTLAVEQPGFKKYVQRDLILPNNAAISAGDVKLEIGQTSQAIEVAARGEQLQTDTAEQATSVTTRQIENTTVAGRTPLALLTLVPGMYTDGDFSTDSNQTGNIYSNGARATQFNVQINGASNLDTGSKTKMMATVSLDMVQEFRVLTSNFDARYGLNAGAQIMIVTKSGSQTFHGAGYWYYRDRGLNANSWTNNRDGLPKAGYHFNYEGYNIGGPAYIPGKFNTAKNKLFFFWAEEYKQQLIPEGVRSVTMPTALERKGDFSHTYSNNNPANPYHPKDYQNGGAPFPGDIIPANRLYAPGDRPAEFISAAERHRADQL